MGIAVIVAMVAALAPTTTQPQPTFCLPEGTDPADRSAIMRLYDVSSFDRTLNMITRPLDADAAGQLRAGVASGRPQVQLSAVVILAYAVKQDALPGGNATVGIARAIAPVAESCTDTVRLHARRVQWILRVKSVEDPAARAAFLAPLLNERGVDGVYYAYEAVDRLSELGSDGERVLASFVAEETKRSIDPEILGRARWALRKISLSRQVERSGPADAVAALVAAVHTPTHRRMESEFSRWVVEQLARRRPEADSQLRGLVRDDGLTDDVREAVRFALTDGSTLVRWAW